MTKKEQTNIELPTSLKKKLKMRAITENKTMTALIIEMLEEGMEKREKQ